MATECKEANPCQSVFLEVQQFHQDKYTKKGFDFDENLPKLMELRDKIDKLKGPIDRASELHNRMYYDTKYSRNTRLEFFEKIDRDTRCISNCTNVLVAVLTVFACFVAVFAATDGFRMRRY